PLPQRQDEATDEQAKERTALRRMHEIARGFFREQLAAPAGAAAHSYLVQRGVEADEINHFDLGYAPGGNRLLARLQREGFTEELLLRSSLVSRSEERGELYDF